MVRLTLHYTTLHYTTLHYTTLTPCYKFFDDLFIAKNDTLFILYRNIILSICFIFKYYKLTSIFILSKKHITNPINHLEVN